MGRSIDLPAPISAIDDVLGSSSKIHFKDSESALSDHDRPSSGLLIYRSFQWLFVLLGDWLFVLFMIDNPDLQSLSKDQSKDQKFSARPV